MVRRSNLYATDAGRDDSGTTAPPDLVGEHDALPFRFEPNALMPSLLTLSDVMSTGHHAALAAKVGPGKSVAVVGDAAVGLCGVIAARHLGAERIIMLGRHADRIALAKEFGATDIVRPGSGLPCSAAWARRSRCCELPTTAHTVPAPRPRSGWKGGS
jgi:Zn-dependent alcohol dehydrogenase